MNKNVRIILTSLDKINMSYREIKCSMVGFFERCGYNVSSKTMQNPILNCIDIFFVVGYLVLSSINLRAATPSMLLLGINAVILCRFILKNLIEQVKIAKSADDKNKNRISIVHIVKICVGLIAMVLLTYFFTWSVMTTNNLAIVKPIVFTVLILTFVENIWAIMERMYGAVPKPLSY